MPSYFDNIFWHSLAGPQSHLAAGTGTARRFQKGLSPIIGFAEREAPDFAALRPFCDEGERLYCAGWNGPAPEGWRIELEAVMVRMVWDVAMPAADPAPDALPLGPEHLAQLLDLTALTNPGPFGPRTIEFGDYFGYVEDGRVIAMAGERTCVPGLREISGVCTHPDYQGRGLGRKLVEKLVRRMLLRDERPYLHVLQANTAARQMYRRLGFADHGETTVRIVSVGSP